MGYARPLRPVVSPSVATCAPVVLSEAQPDRMVGKVPFKDVCRCRN